MPLGEIADSSSTQCSRSQHHYTRGAFSQRWPATAVLNGHSSPTASPRRYRPSNSLDRWASIRRTSRRLPLILGIFIESWAVVWCRIQAITAASARSSKGIGHVASLRNPLVIQRQCQSLGPILIENTSLPAGRPPESSDCQVHRLQRRYEMVGQKRCCPKESEGTLESASLGRTRLERCGRRRRSRRLARPG
jgi:hypothetical protein